MSQSRMTSRKKKLLDKGQGTRNSGSPVFSCSPVKKKREDVEIETTDLKKEERNQNETKKTK